MPGILQAAQTRSKPASHFRKLTQLAMHAQVLLAPTNQTSTTASMSGVLHEDWHVEFQLMPDSCGATVTEKVRQHIETQKPGPLLKRPRH